LLRHLLLTKHLLLNNSVYTFCERGSNSFPFFIKFIN
jgi:hypothetical protein